MGMSPRQSPAGCGTNSWVPTLLHHQEEHRKFSDEELAEGRTGIFGTADSGGSASVAR